MRRLWLTILICRPLFGQLESGSVTVTATRTMALQPDQAVFRASLTTGPDASLDDVLATVAPAGIAAANLTSISGAVRDFTWTFEWVVPLSRTKETVAALESLRDTAPPQSRLPLNFQVADARVSGDSLSANHCATSDLIADARAQAQRMADAVGATVGPVLALGNPDSTLPVGLTVVGQFSFAGSFSGIIPANRLSIVLPASGLLNCSLTVKFRLNQ